MEIAHIQDLTKLKELRLKKGWSVEMLGFKAGVPTKDIENIEGNKREAREIKISTVLKLVRCMDAVLSVIENH